MRSACHNLKYLIYDQFQHQYLFRQLIKMMPPDAFRLSSRPTKSFSNSNVEIFSRDQKRSSKVKILYKHGMDTMSEANICPPFNKMTINGARSQKFQEQEMPPPEPSRRNQFSKYHAIIFEFFQKLGVQPNNQPQRLQQSILETIVFHIKPKVQSILSRNKDLVLELQGYKQNIKNQEDTLNYFKEANRLLQGSENSMKLRFLSIIKEWNDKCQDVSQLQEELQFKDDQLSRLKAKVEDMNREINKISIVEESTSRQIAEETKKRTQVQNQLKKLQEQKDIKNIQKQIAFRSIQTALAQAQIRLKLKEQELKVTSKRSQKLKSNNNKLVKESQQRERYFHQKISQLQSTLHQLTETENSSKMSEYSLVQRIRVLEQENMDLKEQLSSITARFLKLKQFSKISDSKKSFSSSNLE